MAVPKRDIVAGPPELLGLTLPGLEQLMLDIGEKKYRAAQIYDALYVERVPDIADASALPAALRARLQEHCATHSVALDTVQDSADGTKKFLFKLRDGRAIESVLIPSELREEDGQPRRRTLCVSTQVGCNLGCQFCATASLKLTRNLSAGEIVDQFLVAQQYSERPITNVVFMGMGEPMNNYDAVMQSTLILNDQRTKMVAPRRTTLSTAGVVPGIERMADEGRIIKLAVSLHATTQGVREELMPIARKWPLPRLMDAIEYYYRTTRKTVTYEYIMFDGINDSADDVKRLARIARRVPSKVNVIPFHDIDFVQPEGFAAELKPTPPDKFEHVVQLLRDEGVQVMVRSSSGKDIDAACGQLAFSKAS
ncbi:MAG: 23S rRNA (adenine(2503)-C(2))-methyltransferase RlmN [Candidatus Kapabacteria bacterium]|nr:23S rRNA (adenine(2503)-C(2))-methyltransferase RlmN [Candidatus Kapabacteria bacterium]